MPANAKQHEILVVDDRAENCALAVLLNVLDPRRGEQRELVPKRGAIELAPLIATVLSSFAARARAAHVELSSELAASSGWADPELLQAHAGAFWIEDALPGATFCVRLPDGS